MFGLDFGSMGVSVYARSKIMMNSISPLAAGFFVTSVKAGGYSSEKKPGKAGGESSEKTSEKAAGDASEQTSEKAAGDASEQTSEKADGSSSKKSSVKVPYDYSANIEASSTFLLALAISSSLCSRFLQHTYAGLRD